MNHTTYSTQGSPGQAAALRMALWLRRHARSLVIMGCLLSPGVIAFSQDTRPQTATSADTENQGIEPDSRDSNPSDVIPTEDNLLQRNTNEYNTDAGSTTLTTNQIITILHTKPESIVDVKHVMTEFFFKQGIAVQENSITDEMLFSNIATNAALRQALSAWLRARGYARPMKILKNRLSPRRRRRRDAAVIERKEFTGT